MRYLSKEEILVIHSRIIEETGGAHGVHDIGSVASLIERPKMQFGGKELYATIFAKAAAYFESCAMHHPFIDGNKRTAIAIAARFLYCNGYTLETSNKILEEFVLKCVVEKRTIQDIAAWFKKHSKK